jgi:hypothetical protein
MKTILISIALLCCISFSSLSQEQKVTVKKEQVSLNDTPVFKMVSTTYPDAYTIYNLNDEKLIYFNAFFYNSAKQITPGNPQGRIGYFDITFFNDDMDKCEIRIVGAKKALAEHIISGELIKEGKLDDTAVKQFCRINGMKFSEEQKKTTIIIDN